MICCGYPIIHPMFLKQVSFVCGYKNSRKILKNVAKSKPKLFFLKSPEMGQTCFDLTLKYHTELKEEDWFKQLPEESSNNVNKLWTIQPQHLLLQGLILLSFYLS
jgi:hypothetical protein